jgi:hypothetical protein
VLVLGASGLFFCHAGHGATSHRQDGRDFDVS